jgi:hypothetical protein
MPTRRPHEVPKFPAKRISFGARDGRICPLAMPVNIFLRPSRLLAYRPQPRFDALWWRVACRPSGRRQMIGRLAIVKGHMQLWTRELRLSRGGQQKHRNRPRVFLVDWWPDSRCLKPLPRNRRRPVTPRRCPASLPRLFPLAPAAPRRAYFRVGISIQDKNQPRPEGFAVSDIRPTDPPGYFRDHL